MKNTSPQEELRKEWLQSDVCEIDFWNEDDNADEKIADWWLEKLDTYANHKVYEQIDKNLEAMERCDTMLRQKYQVVADEKVSQTLSSLRSQVEQMPGWDGAILGADFILRSQVLDLISQLEKQ